MTETLILSKETLEKVLNGETVELFEGEHRTIISMKKPEINREKLQKILDKLKAPSHKCYPDGCRCDVSCCAYFICSVMKNEETIKVLEALLK
ncbi:MAG TPA: hypothetical protein VMV95_03645 [Bacillota bacterium]|nr:hypothetical protein [Bacillota bacterium]